mgnify:CR=1 FL=1
MKFYILLGPPGAGKGTQAALMVKELDYVHVSTGDALRKEIAKGTGLGAQVKKLIDNGEFVPDSIVEAIIEQVIDSNPQAKGFIFDGFPRTVSQAEDLDLMLAKKGHALTNTICITLPDKFIFERIAHRARIEGRADDAKTDTIQTRIDIYHQRTEPLINFYKGKGLYTITMYTN